MITLLREEGRAGREEKIVNGREIFLATRQTGAMFAARLLLGFPKAETAKAQG